MIVANKHRSVKIEQTILKLLSAQPEVRAHEIAKAMGFESSDETFRKAVQRTFKILIERRLLSALGNGRSRKYVKTNQMTWDQEKSQPDQNAFKGVQLSKQSKLLLDYVSRSLQNRTPVGYNQKFLNDYIPNKTFYLTQTQRKHLFEIGRVEIKIRPAGTYARNILDRLLIDLSWNSSRLEGNTYSLLQTKRLIELGELASGKEASEAQMILNHKASIEYIVESSMDARISSHVIRSLHALLSENLLGDSSASGRIRKIAVEIGGSTYIPIDNPHTLSDYFTQFIKKLNKINDPFEKSLFSLIHLSYLQAFEDVNKRTARLLANIPLIKENLKPLSFIDVNQTAYINALLGVYEKNDVHLIRDLYLWAYQRSSQRYSAVQQSMAEPNILKLKYRSIIQDIIQEVVVGKVKGPLVLGRIEKLLNDLKLPKKVCSDLRHVIETEIMNLHDGNIARFKIRPSEYVIWKKLAK